MIIVALFLVTYVLTTPVWLLVTRVHWNTTHEIHFLFVGAVKITLKIFLNFRYAEYSFLLLEQGWNNVFEIIDKHNKCHLYKEVILFGSHTNGQFQVREVLLGNCRRDLYPLRTYSFLHCGIIIYFHFHFFILFFVIIYFSIIHHYSFRNIQCTICMICKSLIHFLKRDNPL